MIRAIGYVRRSTDRQEESLEQQRTKLQAFAKAKGWTLVDVYTDDAISGSQLQRPGLDQLVADSRSRDDVQFIIAWDRNRLTRPKDPVDGLLLERELIKAGKRVFYAGTGQEADRSFASGLMSYVEHFQNGDYLRKLSRDTMRGIVSRVERGLWPGGPIPFGYDRLILDQNGTPKRIIRNLDDGTQGIIDPESGDVIEHLPKGQRYRKQDHELCMLIPSDPPRVRAVQRMFADSAAGKPTRQLRDDLNNAGFRTSRGRHFTPQTITPMLENPAYTGKCVYNRRTESKWHRHTDGQSVERQDEGLELRPKSDWIVAEDAWPAIIDADTFELVQQQRQASKKRNQRVAGANTRSGYLLTGFIFCGVCGGKLHGMTCTSGKGYKTPYYVCSTHHSGQKDRCPKRYTVPAKVVEDHILGLIRSDLATLRDDDKLHQYVADQLRQISGGDADARQQLQRRLVVVDQKMTTLRGHMAKLDTEVAESVGLYTEAQLLSDERKDIERQLAALSVPSADDLPTTEELRTRASAAFDDMDAVLNGGTIEERREMLSLYVQTIQADPDLCEVRIGLYPPLFSGKIAGARFEPATCNGENHLPITSRTFIFSTGQRPTAPQMSSGRPTLARCMLITGCHRSVMMRNTSFCHSRVNRRGVLNRESESCVADIRGANRTPGVRFGPRNLGCGNERFRHRSRSA